MAYHAVFCSMVTINKLTATLKTLATYLGAKVKTEKGSEVENGSRGDALPKDLDRG
jgi:hypothetical protein